MCDKLTDGERAEGQAPDGDCACSYGSDNGGAGGDRDSFGSEREQSRLDGMIFCGHGKPREGMNAGKARIAHGEVFRPFRQVQRDNQSTATATFVPVETYPRSFGEGRRNCRLSLIGL
jgi:hypothetical protein